MKNIMHILLCVLTISIGYSQNDNSVTVFNHSDKSSLNKEQTEIYDIITKQSDVINPIIVIYKYQLALKEYNNLVLNINVDKSIVAKTSEIVNRNQKHWTWFGTVTNELNEGGYAFITLNEDNLSGEIWTGDYMYKIVPLGDNKGILFEIDPSKTENERLCDSGDNV